MQESFSGGLGLVDLEQLQLEKAGLGIKLAARDHEMFKFLHKRREVVQVFAHTCMNDCNLPACMCQAVRKAEKQLICYFHEVHHNRFMVSAETSGLFSCEILKYATGPTPLSPQSRQRTIHDLD